MRFVALLAILAALAGANSKSRVIAVNMTETFPRTEGTKLSCAVKAGSLRYAGRQAGFQETIPRPRQMFARVSSTVLPEIVIPLVSESLAQFQKHDTPFAEATTSSLEVLKAYSGTRKVHSSRGAAAAYQDLRALWKDADPDFPIELPS